jgi:hypothetical protein
MIDEDHEEISFVHALMAMLFSLPFSHVESPLLLSLVLPSGLLLEGSHSACHPVSLYRPLPLAVRTYERIKVLGCPT